MSELSFINQMTLSNKKQKPYKSNIEFNQNIINNKLRQKQKAVVLFKKRVKNEEEKAYLKENKNISHQYKNPKNKEDINANNNKKIQTKIQKNSVKMWPIEDNSNFITKNKFNKNGIEQIEINININKDFKRLRSQNIMRTNNINNKIIIDKRQNISNFEPNNKLYNIQQLITLKNVDKITYMSSCLYCLINIYHIKYYFTQNLNLIFQNRKIMPICFFFSRIIYHFFINNISNDNKYPINNFFKIIINQNPIFKAKNMRKSIIFLIYLLEKIHDEDKQLANNLNRCYYNLSRSDAGISRMFQKFFQMKEESCILPIFSWVNRKVKICWECGKIFKNFQKFFTYDIDIKLVLNKTMVNEQKNELSIMDCINCLSERTTLFNIYCRNCHQKTNFMKDSHLFLTQKVFIVLLRDMENLEYINEIKNEKIKIKINESLDLSNIVKYKAINNSLRYNIHGIVMFDSENLEYIAYTINQLDEKWYKYVKENASQVELKDFINVYDYKIFPVILFYKKGD